MTNRDKFLRDDVSAEKLAQELEQAVYRRTSDNLSKVFVDFFNKKISALTEDERVILKNIDSQNFKAIGRKDGYLYLRYTDYSYEYDETDIKTLTFWYMFHDLFKFIKNGEEYNIEELLKEGE